jgi:hypothetical protein
VAFVVSVVLCVGHGRGASISFHDAAMVASYVIAYARFKASRRRLADLKQYMDGLSVRL